MHWILNFLWLQFCSETSSNFLIHWLLPPRDSYGLDKKRMTSTAYNEILSRMSNIFMPSTLLLCWILWLICSRVMVKREGKKGHHCLLLPDKVKTSEWYPLFLTVGFNIMSLFKKVLDHCVRLPKLSSNSFLSANQIVFQHIILINISSILQRSVACHLCIPSANIMTPYCYIVIAPSLFQMLSLLFSFKHILPFVLLQKGNFSGVGENPGRLLSKSSG